MAQIEQSDKGKKKKGAQKKMSIHVDSDHVLHALYHDDQVADIADRPSFQ